MSSEPSSALNPCEYVGANDRRHRAAGLIDDGVAATGGGARLGLCLGQGHRGPVRRQGRRRHDPDRRAGAKIGIVLAWWVERPGPIDSEPLAVW